MSSASSNQRRVFAGALEKWFPRLWICAGAIPGTIGVASSALDGDWGPFTFLSLWTVIWVSAGYWALRQTVWRIELDEELLRWQTNLRGGEVPLASISAIEVPRLAIGSCIVYHQLGYVPVHGLNGRTKSLVEALVEAVPSVKVERPLFRDRNCRGFGPTDYST
jgi:hypothetical protein